MISALGTVQTGINQFRRAGKRFEATRTQKLDVVEDVTAFGTDIFARCLPGDLKAGAFGTHRKPGQKLCGGMADVKSGMQPQVETRRGNGATLRKKADQPG